MNYLKTTLITIVFLFAGYTSFAQFYISGTVTGEDGLPMNGVSVSGNNKVLSLTDTSGKYSFIDSTYPTIISFNHVGFELLTIVVKKIPVPTVVLVRAHPVMLEEAVVQAFERNGKLIHTPASITLLNKEALERYGNTSFVPAINAIPGVKMDERSPGSYRLSIRGNLLRSAFGVRNVKFYWNGIPFTDASGNTYLNEVSFNNIDQIEVIKGPSGSMYGSGTGGVVLLSSPVTKAHQQYFLLQPSLGSYGLYSLHTSYNKANSKYNSSLSFTHLQSGGYRDHTKMRRDVANYRSVFFIRPRQQLSVNVFYSDLFYQTPGGLTQIEMNRDPRQSRPAAGIFKSAAAQQAAVYLKTIYAGVSHAYHFNNNLSNTTGIYASYTHFKNPAIRNYERKTEKGIGIRNVFKMICHSFTSVIGGEYQYGFNNTATYGNKLGIKDTLQYHDKISSRHFNLFLQTDFTLKKLLVTGGVSYNNFQYKFLRVSDIGSGKLGSGFRPQVVPRIAASITLNKIGNVYAAVSKGYSPPSIDEVHASDGKFNNALAAETGINYEAGIKFNRAKKLSGDVTYYIFHLQNTIVSRRDTSGAEYYVNAGKTNQRGLEVAVNYIPLNNESRFIRQIKIWGSYTNISARFADYQQGNVKYNGNKLPGTPPNVVVAGIDVHTALRVSGNFTYTYTDAIPLNDANKFFASHYNLLSVKAVYKNKGGKQLRYEIFAVMERSFNNPYSLGNDLNAAGSRFYNPSPPENYTVGAKFQFNGR